MSIIRDNNSNQDDDRDRRLSLDEWVRRIAGDGMDVRIHDSEQAGDLARRLGARAFTAGKDIYIRPELVRPVTREGAAVLAHELYHVAEQTGRPAMPLAPSPGRGQSNQQSPTTQPDGQVVQRQVEGAAGLSVQRSEGATSASEAGAEQQEDATRGNGRRKKRNPPDPDAVAERVYDLMSRELRLDHERTTFGW